MNLASLRLQPRHGSVPSDCASAVDCSVRSLCLSTEHPLCRLFGRTSPPSQGFAWVWNKRAPGTAGVVDLETKVALGFQLLPSGKLLLLPRHVLADEGRIADAVRERNPPAHPTSTEVGVKSSVHAAEGGPKAVGQPSVNRREHHRLSNIRHRSR